LSKVRGIKINIKQILDSDAPDASVREWITPKKATLLSNNTGTLIEAVEGGYYLATIGEWFRSPYYGKTMPQVDEFNTLQDLGFTVIKDKIVRHEEKAKEPVITQPEKPVVKVQPVIKPVVKNNGQALRSQNNVGSKKISPTVAPNPTSEKKD
jgi:hypothetical protein